MAQNTTLMAAVAGGGAPLPEGLPGRPRALRLPHGPKVIIGLVILAVFVVVAIIGTWAAPYSPNATNVATWVRHVLVPGTGPGTGVPAHYYPLPLPPSSSHLLGTTVFAQDVLSQLLASTGATLFVGLLAAAMATVLSVLVGVTAGYIGGLAV
jgi:peptide/nickel transport system permease protein